VIDFIKLASLYKTIRGGKKFAAFFLKKIIDREKVNVLLILSSNDY